MIVVATSRRSKRLTRLLVTQEGGFIAVYSFGVDGTLPTWNSLHKTVSLRGAQQAINKSESDALHDARRPSSLGLRRSGAVRVPSKSSLRDLAASNAKHFEVGREREGGEEKNVGNCSTSSAQESDLISAEDGENKDDHGHNDNDGAEDENRVTDSKARSVTSAKLSEQRADASLRSTRDVVIEGVGDKVPSRASFTRPVLDATIYRFTQTLMRETAYESMLYKQRRNVHSRCVDYFVRTNSDNLEQISTLLANHTIMAERWDDAKTYLCLAGDYSYAENDHVLVLWCFHKLLDIMPDLRIHPTAVEVAMWKRKLGSTYLGLGKTVIGKK